jgi:hypothetical protein
VTTKTHLRYVKAKINKGSPLKKRKKERKKEKKEKKERKERKERKKRKEQKKGRKERKKRKEEKKGRKERKKRKKEKKVFKVLCCLLERHRGLGTALHTRATKGNTENGGELEVSKSSME